MKKHTNILQNGVAAIFGGIFIASLLPVLWVAPFVRSTGDDLNYSAGVHMALMRGEGLGGVLCAVADSVRGTWYSWQGTWSSIALFSLQPGVWGNKWYPLTVAVALICILAGTWYFLHTVLRLLGMKRSGRWTLAFLLGTLLIQYLPNDKCGLFWWTSVAHYMVPYGITMMCMGWSLRWLESGRFSDRGSSWNGLSGRCRISGGGIGGSLVFPFDCRRVNSKAQCKTQLVADSSFSVGDGGVCV